MGRLLALQEHPALALQEHPAPTLELARQKEKADTHLEGLLKQLNEQRKSDMHMMMSSFAEQTRQLTSGIMSMFGKVLKAMKQH